MAEDTLALGFTRTTVGFRVVTPTVDAGGDSAPSRIRVEVNLTGEGGLLVFTGLSGWVVLLGVLRIALLLTLAFGRVTRGELVDMKDFVGDGGRDVGRVLFLEEGLEGTGDTSL